MAVVSGKGGTGKTTVAVNLAVLLAQQGENTLLVDANLDAPHVGFHFGDGIYKHTLHDVLNNKIGYSQAVQYDSSGLKIVPGDPMGKVQGSTRKLKEYKHAADFVIFDAAAQNHSVALEHADQVLVVTQASIPALIEAKKLVNQARKDTKVVLGVILNGVGKGDLSAEQAEAFLGHSLIAQLPQDIKIQNALHQQEPFVNSHPRHPFTQQLRDVAYRLRTAPKE